MSIKVLVMASLFLFAFFAVKSYSVDWDNPDSQTIDEMIASPDQGSVMPSSVQMESPQAARAAQVGQPGREILGGSTSNALSSAATNPKDARSQETNQTVAPEQVVANSTSPSATPSTPVQSKTSTGPASVSGSWSLVLNDSMPHMAVLTLFQNGSTVYGTGNINLNANTTAMTTASGTVTGDKLNLDMVSLGRVSLYHISMTLNGDSASGSYATLSPSSASAAGTVSGLRSVPTQ